MKTKTKKKARRIIGILSILGLWAAIPFAVGDRVANADELSDTRIGATLTGPPIGGTAPAGFSEYRLDDQGRRRLRVEGTSINLAQGTSLQIVVNNAAAGNTTVSQFGTIFFDIDTGNGQNVPVINIGNPIQITNGSTVVLTGTFGSVTPTPSPTGSPFPSPSPSASPTGSPSPSPSPTGTPTGTPSPSPNPSPSPSPTGTPNAGNLFAALSGPTINGVLPGGYAEFELHSSRVELEVRVRQVNLPAGTTVGVIVDSVSVGSMFISSGEGRLRLRSDEGQTVPPVIVGSTINITNGGSTILTGRFAGFTGPTPGPFPSPSPTGTPGPTPSPTPTLGRSFEAHLNGSQVQPPVQTAANGEIKVSLNAAETQATIFGEFHNLGSDQTGARIDAMTSSGGTITDLGIVGGRSGNFASRTIELSAAQVAQLRSGLWSAVITSVSDPNGEIRGTLTPRSNVSDFDGDGSHDFAVFRPSTGTWYSDNSSGFGAQVFGSGGDKIVSGDYDGDGKTDAAVFRNVNGSGVWEIKRSSDGGVTAEQFGFSTDTPVRGDFDGDGRGDYAVYRKSSGVWYVKRSSDAGFTIVQFGLAEDDPAAADFDGDGKQDIAVFRPGTGVWYWLRSSDGQSNAVRWGMSGDIAVSGDFDGDGKADPTVYRPSTGVWYIFRSTDGGFSAAQFGLSGDIPSAGNYDADGKTDIAVFRPSDGNWYILRSSDGGYTVTHFGQNGDMPVIAR